jgi:hypothetical protein
MSRASSDAAVAEREGSAQLDTILSQLYTLAILTTYFPYDALLCSFTAARRTY